MAVPIPMPYPHLLLSGNCCGRLVGFHIDTDPFSSRIAGVTGRQLPAKVQAALAAVLHLASSGIIWHSSAGRNHADQIRLMYKESLNLLPGAHLWRLLRTFAMAPSATFCCTVSCVECSLAMHLSMGPLPFIDTAVWPSVNA